MEFAGFLLAVCGLIVLVAATGMCTKCFGGRGKADFTSTGSVHPSKNTVEENTTVVIGTE
jgi:hypothetical protein